MGVSQGGRDAPHQIAAPPSDGGGVPPGGGLGGASQNRVCLFQTLLGRKPRRIIVIDIPLDRAALTCLPRAPNQEPVALLRSRLLKANVPEAMEPLEVTTRPITAQVLQTFEEAQGESETILVCLFPILGSWPCDGLRWLFRIFLLLGCSDSASCHGCPDLLLFFSIKNTAST